MRSYGQYCGLARSLEVVGDRWNLLIVRQLLIAPARYRDLIEGLPGIATNLLADRLRDLESSGVVERRLTGAGSTVEYALTAWGAQLREPIEGLIRWSTPLMTSGPGGDIFRPEWLALAVPALLNARGPGPAHSDNRPRDRRRALRTPFGARRIRSRLTRRLPLRCHPPRRPRLHPRPRRRRPHPGHRPHPRPDRNRWRRIPRPQDLRRLTGQSVSTVSRRARNSTARVSRA